jgi:hypothetical protein
MNLINSTNVNFKIKEIVNKKVQLENIWCEYKNKTIDCLNNMKKIGLKFHHSKISKLNTIYLFRIIVYQD